MYKLRDWIPEERIDYSLLSSNPHPAAIELLEKNQDKINWFFLSANPSAIHILKKNPDKLYWDQLCRNRNIKEIDLIIKKIKDKNYIQESEDAKCFNMLKPRSWYNIFMDFIYGRTINDNIREFYKKWNDIRCFDRLSGNPEAIHILEQNSDKIDWCALSGNPKAIHLLEQNPDKINWMSLSKNPAAIHLLEQNPDKIYWVFLSMNPAAIHLLEQNPDKIDWFFLSYNPNSLDILQYNQNKIHWEMFLRNKKAIHFIEKNQDKINYTNIGSLLLNEEAMDIIELYKYDIVWNSKSDYFLWEEIFRNPGIFIYDYTKMRESRIKLHEELIEWFWHPRRIEKFLLKGNLIDELDNISEYI